MPHVSVYVDESGDVGFKQKSSEFFTIGYVFTIDRFPTKESKKMETLLKNINVGIRKHNKKILEFKFSHNTDIVREKVFRQIQKLDVNIGVVCISKDSVQQHLKTDSSMFYRYVVIENIVTTLVNDYLKTYDPYNSISLLLIEVYPKIKLNHLMNIVKKKCRLNHINEIQLWRFAQLFYMKIHEQFLCCKLLIILQVQHKEK
jgi:hypothetical protein